MKTEVSYHPVFICLRSLCSEISFALLFGTRSVAVAAFSNDSVFGVSIEN